jgi:hypothetical protein
LCARRVVGRQTDLVKVQPVAGDVKVMQIAAAADAERGEAAGS